MADEGFFSRWSRLKSDARSQPEQPPAPAKAGDSPLQGTVPLSSDACEARRLPTLEDVQRLGGDSDYSAFVAQGVDPSVRRLALRKLFADPHFNVRDGLDVYMGDYTLPSPVPAAMLASLAHASAWLGLGPEAGQQDDGASQPAPPQQAAAPEAASERDEH